MRDRTSSRRGPPSPIFPVPKLFLFLVLTSACAAQTLTVFSDFGSGGTFSSQGFCVSGRDSTACTTLASRWIAAPFTPTTTVTFRSLSLAIANVSGINGAIVSLRSSDSTGLPDTTLESWVISDLPSYYGQQPATISTVTSGGNVILQAGQQYWVEVQGAAADTVDYWFANLAGLNGGLQNVSQTGWTPIDFYPNQNRGALQVTGLPLSTGELVASPALLGFLATAGQVSPVQDITVTSTSGTLSFTAVAGLTSPAPANWLTVSPGTSITAPGSPAVTAITVTSAAEQFAPGTYTANVTIHSATQTLIVPVTLQVLQPGGSGASQQVITTIAGKNWSFPISTLQATDAPLGGVTGVAADGMGNIYVADPDNNVVVKISPDGTLKVVAGNRIQGYSGDGGPATSASLAIETGVAVDAAGNLFIADTYNNRVREVTTDGVISTVAGSSSAGGFSGDGGPATSALLNGPAGVAVDSAGNLYIADRNNERIRQVTNGMITTIAGNGVPGYADGPALSASLNGPTGLAVDSEGNLYIADSKNAFVRRLSNGVMATIAVGDSGALYPQAVALDSGGNLYITDTLQSRILRVSSANTGTGTTTVIAGVLNKYGYSGDGGPAATALLSSPSGVAVDPAGNLFIADEGAFVVRKAANGIITTVAGDGAFQYSGDGGAPTQAALNSPAGVAIDGAGDIYFADSGNNRIRKISNGTITTVAGNGIAGSGGDGGPAVNASLNNPNGVAVDAAGTLYIADTGNNLIRAVVNGKITTLAGNTAPGLYLPAAVLVDTAGSLYIADSGNNLVRRLSGGKITTIAGSGVAGFSGDGGPAIQAKLDYPNGLALDAAGNLYIADAGNYRVRVVSGGTIKTVAGDGQSGFTGDGGPATSATLGYPEGLATDSAGALYIVDAENNCLRKVFSGTITTLAGTGAAGFSGDGGPAQFAQLSGRYDVTAGVATDLSGNVYLADAGNDRIRALPATPPALKVSPVTLNFTGQTGGAAPPTQSFSVLASVSSGTFTASVDSGSANWLSVTPQEGATPRLVEVLADPANLTTARLYTGTITIFAPNSSPSAIQVTVNFTVTQSGSPLLTLDTRNLTFPFVQGSAVQSQKVTVINSGGGTLSFTSTAATISPGGPRLTVSPSAGTASAAASAMLTVSADPTGVMPGTYSGSVTVASANGTSSIPVVMTVSSLNQAILLSQRGLSFTAVQGGGVLPPQTFSIMNIGSEAAAWTVSGSTLAGGPGWLKPKALDASNVIVSVDPSGLPAGAYYGLVSVNAAGAANSPQVVTVFLQVLSPNISVPAVVQPGTLVFTAQTGGESPGSQTVMVYNINPINPAPRSFHAATDSPLLVNLPADATLDPAVPTPVVIQPLTSGLAAGVYSHVLTLQFSDGQVSRVNVTVIVSNTAPGGSVIPNQRTKRTDTALCSPNKLLPALTGLTDSFQSAVGWPVALEVTVRDNCGSLLQLGQVTAQFSNGDPPMPLIPSSDGQWGGTWPIHNPASSVTIKVHAQSADGTLTGDQQVSGDLQSPQKPPTFDISGVVGIFGGSSYAPIAPGGVISIYGDLLADVTASASSFPLLPALGDTQVIIQGTPMPLYYVGTTQINAVVPFMLQANAPIQLLVARGLAYSLPVSVSLAPAQPEIVNLGPPQYAGAIYSYPVGGGAPYLVSAASPAHPGDTIALYCSGLGAVMPPVQDGYVASGGSTTTANVLLSIGGQIASIQFQGLAAGFAGLYQVNAVVPLSAPAGNAVPVTLSIDGQTSPQITLAIQ